MKVVTPEDFTDIAINKIIPKILDVLEESGISTYQAQQIPSILNDEIDRTNRGLMAGLRFRANPKKWIESI